VANGGITNSNNGHLTSWKEIASYLGRSVRTVQRWEQDAGLPVRRPRGKSHDSVMAVPAELDAWFQSRPLVNSAHGQTGSNGNRDGLASYEGAAPISPPRSFSELRRNLEITRTLREQSRFLQQETRATLESLIISIQQTEQISRSALNGFGAPNLLELRKQEAGD
jgi:hypothetical protein